MKQVEKKLIQDAHEKYKDISPVRSCKDFEHSFTKQDNKIIFWFQTRDNSTHILVADMEG